MSYSDDELDRLAALIAKRITDTWAENRRARFEAKRLARQSKPGDPLDAITIELVLGVRECLLAHKSAAAGAKQCRIKKNVYCRVSMGLRGVQLLDRDSDIPGINDRIRAVVAEVERTYPLGRRAPDSLPSG